MGLVPLIIAAAASADTIPLSSTGALRAFAPGQNVVFNTDNGTYQVGSTTYSGGRAVTLYSNAFPTTTYVFDFSNIIIAAGIDVTATGTNPLFLLAQTSATIDGLVNVSGAPGSAGGANGAAVVVGAAAEPLGFSPGPFLSALPARSSRMGATEACPMPALLIPLAV